MKRHIQIVFYCLFVWILSSCNEKAATAYHIGVSQCSNDAWRTKLNEEMQRELLFHPNIELEVRSAGDNNESQAADIDYFIQKHVDLLIVSPNEAQELTPAVSKAYDAGIPVIVADRKVTNDKYSAFIGGDNLEVGKLMGQYLINHLPEGGKVLEVMGLQGSTPTVLRHEGLMKTLATADARYEMLQCSGNWFQEQAEAKVDSMLNVHEDIRIILAQNDQMAIGASRAVLKSRNAHGIIIMGVDGLTGPGNGVEAISEGRIDASAAYATAGDLIIQTAVKILNNESFERNTELETYLIDAENAPLINNIAKEVAHEVETVQMLKGRVDYFWEQHNLERALLYTLLSFLFIFMLMFAGLMRQLNAKRKANERLARKRNELIEKNKQLTNLSEELAKATAAKLTFFTNVSHDLRTPLTLISAPIEYLLSSIQDKQQQQLLNIANKNVQILLRLINQILDFRKYESGKMELDLQNLDLKEMVETWFTSFDGLAHKRHIHLNLNIADQESGSYRTAADASKLERIFFNIVGNAFKFTPENGDIDIYLSQQDNEFILRVEDTGPGIHIGNIQKIFEQFYQIDSLHQDGSGLGLALAKSFVELHGGTIEVGNRTDRSGTIITVKLPVNPQLPVAKETIPEAKISQHQIETELLTFDNFQELDAEDPKSVILIIDDNPDIRLLFSTLVGSQYHIIAAANGQEGITKAMRIVPNLIVCDVMMPGMDGFECCRRLKNEVNTSHIPILMLTACSLDEERIQGHNQGADAYLSKPFNPSVLMAQIDALIKSHDRIRDFFGDNLTTTESKSTAETKNTSSLEDAFLQRVRQNILDHIDDPDFGVEQMGEELGMSRAQLYRKVKAITNYSPVELVRSTRLKRGQQLLAQGDETIAQVAYAVGFTSPSYFTKCYKEFFGESPNEILKRKG